jgi:hypothetical protein
MYLYCSNHAPDQAALRNMLLIAFSTGSASILLRGRNWRKRWTNWRERVMNAIKRVSESIFAIFVLVTGPQVSKVLFHEAPCVPMTATFEAAEAAIGYKTDTVLHLCFRPSSIFLAALHLAKTSILG